MKSAGILAYLALRMGRACPREELYEAIWPDEPIETAANRFRVALTSLRKQLEPDGCPGGSVIDTTERGRVRLRAETVWCDAFEIDTLLRQGRMQEASAHVNGDLLPGYYDEWVLTERERYAAVFRGIDSSRQADSSPLPCPAPNASRHSDSQTASPDFTKQLPFYLTRFFGREPELRQIADMLAANRLVTLTGPGGIGKSRIAAEAARGYAAHAFFIPLADIADEDRLVEWILNALSVVPQPGIDMSDHLISWLARREPALLVLDNAEHLIVSVAGISLSLLASVERLRILVTSRRKLDIPGEACLPLAPLGVPTLDTSSDFLETPAVALFVDRAKSARPDFTAGPRQAGAVDEICRRLEGMPLGIELAAARVGIQTVGEIAAELAVRLTDLRSNQHRIPARHRSLRAAIQGSVDILEPRTREVFAALSTFREGWTRDAAAFVSDFVSENDDAQQHLAALVAGSLITARESSRGMRYEFLETIRQFASEMMSPAEQVSAEARHFSYYLRIASNADQDDVRTLAPLDADQENLAVALANAEPGWTDEFWCGLAGAITHAFVRGRHRVALRWLENALGRIPHIESEPVRFRVTYAACLILPDVGRNGDAERLAESMKADAKLRQDPNAAAYAQSILGYLTENAGEYAAASAAQLAALEAARALNDQSLLLHCLSHASGALHNLGNHLGARTPNGRDALGRAEDLARELRDIVPPWSRRVPLAHLLAAAAVYYQGRPDEATALLRQSVDSAEHLGTHAELMFAAAFASDIALETGRTRVAALLFGAFDDLRDRMGYSDERLAVFHNGWPVRFADKLRLPLGGEPLAPLLEQGRRTPLRQLLDSTI